ncbi:MAG: SMR family transporter [Candidatus Marithrix sp.]
MMAAIILDVFSVVAMKLSNGFTKLIPIILTILFYIMSSIFFAFTLQIIDISIAYSVSSGLGTVIIIIIGIVQFKEQFTLIKITSISIIVLGIIGLNLGS